MTTDAPPTPNPVEALLRELVARDDARNRAWAEHLDNVQKDKENREKSWSELQAEIRKLSSEQARILPALGRVEGELQRQDSQIHTFDQRISGNYKGISVQLELLHKDHVEYHELLHNVEVAVVDLTRASRTLHGRMIEESNIVGGRLKRAEDELVLAERKLTAAVEDLKEFERRLAANGIHAAAGGGGGDG